MRSLISHRSTFSSLALLCFVAITALPAQARVERGNWRQADKFSSTNLRKFVYGTSVTPAWIGKSEKFWYSYRTSAGTQFWIVDAEQRTKKPLFDHVNLATALSVATRKPQQAWQLELGGARVDDQGSKLEFTCEGRRFEYELATAKLTDKGPAPRQEAGRGRGGAEGVDVEELRRRFEERRDLGDREQQQQQEQEQQQQEQQQEQQQNQQQNQQQQVQQEQTETQRTERGRGRGRRGGGGAGGPGGGDVRVMSPDGRAYVIAREHDLYFVEGTELPPEPVAEAKPVTAAPVAAESAGSQAGAAKGLVMTLDDVSEQGIESVRARNGDAGNAKVETAKIETVKLEDTKVEEGKVEIAKIETAKIEDTKVDAGKVEIAKVETAMAETAKVETAKLDAGKAESALVVAIDAGSTDSAKAEAAKANGTVVEATKAAAGNADVVKVADTKTDAAQTVKTAQTVGTDAAKAVAVAATPAAPEKPGAAPAPAAPKAPRMKFDEAAALRLSTDSVEGFSFAGGGGRGGQRGGGQTRGNRGGEGVTQTNAAAPAAAPARARANATWSKDSKAFFATRRDSRGVQELFLVDSLGQPRPTLQTYPYSMPGEAAVAHSELWVFDRGSKKLRRVDSKWTHESYQDVHFFGDGSELRFVRRDRLQRNAELCALDPATGAVKVLLSETIEDATLALQNVRYLEKRKQLVWWSERSGWGHFYLHDAATGALVNSITAGTFRAGRLLEVDEETGTMWIVGNGRESNENIYHEHLYRVGLDGKDMVCLDPGDASHRSTLSPSRRYVIDTFSRVDLAPRSVLRSGRDGGVLLELEVADVSKLTEMGWKMPERFTVKAADGVTDLYGNLWKPFDFDAGRRYPVIVNVYPGPQQEGVTHTFSATASTQQLAQLGFVVIQVGHRGGTPARDKAYGAYGFGNLRDYGLEDKKAAIEQLADRFPFVDITRIGIYGHSGGGFMSAAALLKPPYNRFFKVAVASAGNHDNNIYNAGWSERWHGLGERSATTATTGQQAQGAAGATGNTTAQNAQTSTQGTTGQQTTGQQVTGEQTTGQQTTGQQGVQQQQQQEGQRGRRGRGGEGEQQRGGTQGTGTQTGTQTAAAQSPFEIKVPTNAELAANLEGKLLLVHGEIDNNVHPANTMRLVDALIKANKRFDMLIIPGARHGFGAAQEYFRQRMFEYLAEHLLGDCQRGADITRKDG